MPGFASSSRASLKTPLLFDPGERWEYGVSTDWVGLLVQQASGQSLSAYFAEHLLGPLGMTDTAIRMRPDMQARLASIHARLPEGGLAPIDLVLPQQPETEMGGQALYGTAGDYLKFIRMILNRGVADKGRVRSWFDLFLHAVELPLVGLVVEVHRLGHALLGRDGAVSRDI